MTTTTTHPELDGLGSYKFGWSDSDAAGTNARVSTGNTVPRSTGLGSILMRACAVMAMCRGLSAVPASRT